MIQEEASEIGARVTMSDAEREETSSVSVDAVCVTFRVLEDEVGEGVSFCEEFSFEKF